MSIAHVCKRCSKFQIGSSYCDLHKKTVSQWNDWCDWRKDDYESWKSTL